MATVMVIGAGVSGLSCAHNILDQMPDCQLTILEASSRVGGAIGTVRERGWVVEAGPNAFTNQHEATIRLVCRLGLEDALITPCAQNRGRYILIDGQIRRYPRSLDHLQTSAFLTPEGSARALTEPSLPAAPPSHDESIGAFARRRLGPEAALRMLDPIVAGIYAGNPDQLSVAASMPRLAQGERDGRSLLHTLIPPQRAPGAKPMMFSFRNGMGSLIEALHDKLKPHIHLNSPVQALHQTRSGWRISVGGINATDRVADIVVLAVPTARAARLVQCSAPDLGRACAAIPAVPVTVVALGFRTEDIPRPLDGFGHLIPSTESGSVLGVIWSSSMFPGTRSPEGHVLLRVFLGGARDQRIGSADDATLIHQAATHLRHVLDVTAEPRYVRCFRHPSGLPQYIVGHRNQLARIEESLLDLPGLFLIGNAYRGVGISACTKDSERFAAHVAAYGIGQQSCL